MGGRQDLAHRGQQLLARIPFGLALKDVHLALEEADPERFTVLARLLESGSKIVDQGLGNEDVTVVTRALEVSMPE